MILNNTKKWFAPVVLMAMLAIVSCKKEEKKPMAPSGPKKPQYGSTVIDAYTKQAVPSPSVTYYTCSVFCYPSDIESGVGGINGNICGSKEKYLRIVVSKPGYKTFDLTSATATIQPPATIELLPL